MRRPYVRCGTCGPLGAVSAAATPSWLGEDFAIVSVRKLATTIDIAPIEAQYNTDCVPDSTCTLQARVGEYEYTVHDAVTDGTVSVWATGLANEFAAVVSFDPVFPDDTDTHSLPTLDGRFIYFRVVPVVQLATPSRRRPWAAIAAAGVLGVGGILAAVAS